MFLELYLQEVRGSSLFETGSSRRRKDVQLSALPCDTSLSLSPYGQTTPHPLLKDRETPPPNFEKQI
jgi:hypothetical protein